MEYNLLISRAIRCEGFLFSVLIAQDCPQKDNRKRESGKISNGSPIKLNKKAQKKKNLPNGGDHYLVYVTIQCL